MVILGRQTLPVEDSMNTDRIQLEKPGRPGAEALEEDCLEICAWRLLYVEEDEVESLKATLALRYDLPVGSKIDHVADLSEAEKHLRQGQYDAVLAGISFAQGEQLEFLDQLISRHESLPVLVLSDDESPEAALTAGRLGASTILFKSSLSGDLLGEALRKAIGKSSCKKQVVSSERRTGPRHAIDAAAVIFPIQTDGTPGREIMAVAVEIGQAGIGLRAEQDSELVPDVCLVGIECRDGKYRYATVEWRQRRLALPAIHFGGRFLRRADDPFHETHLTPRFNAKELCFRPSMDSAVVGEWVARGVLQPQMVDRVKVCPQCESLPTFRNGCPQCGTPNTQSIQLIHHFACAHVAPLSEFGGESLVCPKCQVKNLVVGADFEYLDGPFSCSECDWSDSHTALIGECLKCAHRFDGREAIEKDVFRYNVDRLDPLAFIQDSQ